MNSSQILLPGLIRTSEAALVGLTPAALRGPAFRRPRRGIYVPAEAQLDDPDARIAIAAAALPDGVVVGGWAAARLHERNASAVGPDGHRLEVFDGRTRSTDRSRPMERILVCAPRAARLSRAPDVRIFRSDVTPDEQCVIDDVPMTTPVRTAFDLSRLGSLWPAVIALDRLRSLGVVDATDLDEMILTRRRWRGSARAQRALMLSDDRVESPRETILRLLWMEASLPRPRCNAVILDAAGQFVARVDLLDEPAGVVGEYDGGFHSSAARRSADAFRQERLEVLGLVTIRATDADVESPARRGLWQGRLRAAYRRARERPGPRRAWSVADANRHLG